MDHKIQGDGLSCPNRGLLDKGWWTWSNPCKRGNRCVLSGPSPRCGKECEEKMSEITKAAIKWEFGTFKVIFEGVISRSWVCCFWGSVINYPFCGWIFLGVIYREADRKPSILGVPSWDTASCFTGSTTADCLPTSRHTTSSRSGRPIQPIPAASVCEKPEGAGTQDPENLTRQSWPLTQIWGLVSSEPTERRGYRNLHWTCLVDENVSRNEQGTHASRMFDFQ